MTYPRPDSPAKGCAVNRARRADVDKMVTDLLRTPSPEFLELVIESLPDEHDLALENIDSVRRLLIAIAGELDGAESLL